MTPPPCSRAVSRRTVVATALGAATAASLPLLGRRADAAEVPPIAAASDLQFALPELAELFAKQSGRAVRPVFGSSGNFRRQIAQGAPFEMFLSADEGFVEALHREGHTEGEGALYAVGRLALFAPKASPVKPDKDMRDLAAALEDGRLRKFAIANPEHAPYGRAAQQALEKAGLWEKIRPKLVLGENISQAAQFAASGTADGGIIAYSLAVAPSVAPLGSYALLPETMHEPLRQRMALLKNAGPTARRFYEFVQSPPARAVFRRHGFALPGEPTA